MNSKYIVEHLKGADHGPTVHAYSLDDAYDIARKLQRNPAVTYITIMKFEPVAEWKKDVWTRSL